MDKWRYFQPQFECDRLNYYMLKFAPWSGHRGFVYDFMNFYKPQRVAELGSHYGCSAFTFAQAAKDFALNTRMYFVDTWEGDDFTKKYNNDVYAIFSKTVRECYINQNINMLRKTFDEAASDFEDGSIDLLHIDGSHHYDDVKNDFETWLPKVKRGGVIMLHDISADTVLGDIMGSHKYWQELKNSFSHTFEFDFSWGLGIIFLDEAVYNNFISSGVDKAAYQRQNNALDVEYKDELRKNYFRLADNGFYIEQLKKDKDTLERHIEAYKKSAEEIKQNYEARINKTIADYEQNISDIKAAFNAEITAVKADYEKQLALVHTSYGETIRGKDEYIAELEQIRAQRDELRAAYENSIDFKLDRLKSRIKR